MYDCETDEESTFVFEPTFAEIHKEAVCAQTEPASGWPTKLELEDLQRK